jgi:biotin carboxyl carrier protein
MDTRSLVNDARVLLAQLGSSQWSELHVRTPQGEIFIGRPGARPNPMRVAGSGAASEFTDSGPQPARAAEALVRAPHVGTVGAVLPAGSRVEANAVVLRLLVLGEETEVRSPHAGVVGEILAGAGAFVEYDSPLFSLLRTQ